MYRAINSVKASGAPPEVKTTKIRLWLRVENNSKFVRGKGKSPRDIEDYCLSEYDARKLDNGDYELTFKHTDDEDLERQIYALASEMSREADLRNGFVERDFSEYGTDRSW